MWIGNNDVLGAALNGGDLASITPQNEFQTKFTNLLTELRQKTHAAIVMANIPNVADIPFVNTLDIIFRTSPSIGITTPVPVIFDANFQPVDFSLFGGSGLYFPILTEETNVVHMTLPALSAYQNGIGVPDSAALVGMGLAPTIAQGVIQGMIAGGLKPTGIPMPGNVTITAEELDAIKTAVDGFNQTIATLAGQFKVPVVDANGFLDILNTSGIEGYTGLFALLDPANTAFSLDGVHPNNGGYALIANKFIEKINESFGLSIPLLNAAEFKGQYTAPISRKIALEAIEQVKAIF